MNQTAFFFEAAIFFCNVFFTFVTFQEFGNNSRAEDNDVEEVSDEVSSLSGPDSFSESDSNPA